MCTAQPMLPTYVRKSCPGREHCFMHKVINTGYMLVQQDIKYYTYNCIC